MCAQKLEIGKLTVQHLGASDLCVQVGEVVSLSGQSGSGKSLFLRALADLVVNEGHICLNGSLREEISAPNWRKQVIFVGADPVWWADTVKEHFRNPSSMVSFLEAMKLDKGAMNWPVSRLSSGEEQRLCLLRALEGVESETPCFLLLDEPTSALDEETTEAVEDLIAQYMENYPLGVLLVSHDREQVKRWASRHWEINADHQVEQVS